MRQVFRKDILHSATDYDKLSEAEKSEYYDRKDFIAKELKFVNEGAFNFVNCDNCNEPLMFYVVSV